MGALTTRLVPVMLLGAAIMFAYAPFLIVEAPPEATMGLVQKIFYFHVPAAMMTFFAAFICGVSSGIFLWRRSPRADQVAVAAAELAVLFGLIVLVTGPLWARKSWNAWWVWDARVTMTLVMWMIFVSYLLLRRFGGPGSDVLSAAVGLFGTALVPFVYVSVNIWRTQHPQTTVINTLPPEMRYPFRWAIMAFLLLFGGLLLARIKLESNRAAVDAAYRALED